MRSSTRARQLILSFGWRLSSMLLGASSLRRRLEAGRTGAPRQLCDGLGQTSKPYHHRGEVMELAHQVTVEIPPRVLLHLVSKKVLGCMRFHQLSGTSRAGVTRIRPAL